MTKCTCDALGQQDRVHAFECPVAQEAMAAIQAKAEATGITFEQMRDTANAKRKAALDQLTPEARQAIAANDALSDQQIDDMARDMIEVLRMYNVTRSEARRIVARMPGVIDRTPSTKWTNPFEGTGMSVIKGERK